jgi:N-methylhydantoinase B
MSNAQRATSRSAGPTKVDPISFEVIRHKLVAITEEQATTMRAISGSPVVTDVADFNTGIYDANGDAITMGFHVLFHSGTLPAAIRNLISSFKKNPGFEMGDQFALNDPYRGTVHQSDVMMMAPIMFDGEIVAWSGCCAHEIDIGAMTYGLAVGSTEVQQEGMLLPGIKLVERDTIRQDLWQMMMGMSREPLLLGLDLNGMIATNRLATRRFLELIERYGLEVVKAVMMTEIETTERQFRARLSSLPDGIFRANDFIQHDGHSDQLYKVALTVEKRGDQLFADFTGSSPQAPGLINCTKAGMRGAFFATILPILAPDIRWNEGIVNAIQVTGPEGSIVNAKWPAPVAGATTGAMWAIMNATQAAVSRLVALGAETAGDATAVSKGSFLALGVRGSDRDGGPFGTYILDGMAGGGGAYANHDGLDPGVDFAIPKPRIGNVEDAEVRSPYLYLYRTRQIDSGGPGRSRGGVGTAFAITPYETTGLSVATFGMGMTVPSSTGLAGGLEGSTNTAYMVERAGETISPIGRVADVSTLGAAGGSVRGLEAKTPFFHLPLNDIVAIGFQGGGGYGDPIERDQEAVRQDVLNGLVSTEAAERCYGVVVRKETVDPDATLLRRQAIRRARLGGVEPSRKLPDDVPIPPAAMFLIGEDRTFRCRCGQHFGHVRGDWKQFAKTRVVEPVEHGPMIKLRDELELREHACPGCGSLLESELALRNEPHLRTIELML